MDTPGKILKAERARQGKSLQEISVNLKLGNDYLTAIEEDNYSELPAEVFTKAYLRLYAHELGLDGDYILDLFHNFGKEDVTEKTVLPEKKSDLSLLKLIKPVFSAVNASVIKIKSSIKINPDFFKKLKASFNFDPGSLKKLKPPVKMDITFIKRTVSLMTTRKSLLVAGAVIAVILVVTMVSDPDKPVPDKPVVADKQFIPGKTSVGEKKELKTIDKTKVHPEKKKQRVEEKISGQLVLKIIAEELTWASVSIDGGEYKESLLHAGEAVTVRAEEKFNLKVGNAGGTKLVLNGKELGKLGPHGKVVNMKLP